MMMNKFYAPVNQNEIKFYKFKSFEYYCNFFLIKKKKKSKIKNSNTSSSSKAAFYFDQFSKLDSLLDKYFVRMNNPPDFSIENELFKKITEETDQYIKANKKMLLYASKDVIYCIKKIMRIKEKVEYYNTHFFSNSINIIVFIRSQINQFFESKPNVILNPNLTYTKSDIHNSKDYSKSFPGSNNDKFDYNYNKAVFDIECPVEVLETFFENEFRSASLIKNAPNKIISLCQYIHKNLIGRFQQLETEDISQTIRAMSYIYDRDLLYIIPNLVDDFVNNYLQDVAPNDFEELKNISVQIMARNFYNCLHRICKPIQITLTPSKNLSSANSITTSHQDVTKSKSSLIKNRNELKSKTSYNINSNELKSKTSNELKNKNSNVLKSKTINELKSKTSNEVQRKANNDINNNKSKIKTDTSDNDDKCDSYADYGGSTSVTSTGGGFDLLIESTSDDSYSSEDSKPSSTDQSFTEQPNSDPLPSAITSKHVLRDHSDDKISFGPLQKYIHKYCKIFNIRYNIKIEDDKKSKKKKVKNNRNDISNFPTNERMVIRCSFVRILCNIIYTNFPGFLYEPVNPKFFEACEKVRISTPKEMEINPKIICEFMMNKPFNFLVESDDLYSKSSNCDDYSSNSSSDQILKNQLKRKRSWTFNSSNDKQVTKKGNELKENELKQASNLINETQFITNPIDIIHNIYLSLNLINEFFQKCGTVKKFGSLNCKVNLDGKEYDSKSELNTSFLAFDDIFPLFCMVISYAAPSNAVAVGDFLARTEDLKLGSQFEFAKLLFTSAIEYIINDVENDLMKIKNQGKS